MLEMTYVFCLAHCMHMLVQMEAFHVRFLLQAILQLFLYRTLTGNSFLYAK